MYSEAELLLLDWMLPRYVNSCTGSIMLYLSAGYSKHEFARIPVAAFTLIQLHYEFDFHSYRSFCMGLVSMQPIRVGM